MEFIETHHFADRLRYCLSESDYHALQNHLLARPDAGQIIPGARGLRKIRWYVRGRGKRGGCRVIYYWHVVPEVITLLDIYRKNRTENLSRDEIKALQRTLDGHGFSTS